MRFSSTASRRAFARFAWLTLAYNIPVILWGAYVRLSFSGDGCGAHWPTCNGAMIPQHMAAPMAIEFTHRMMTSLDSALTIVLVGWAFLAFPRRHGVRRFAAWSLVFLLVEALLGAGLVLLRYVAHDQSAGRAMYLSAHLTNTILLLAAFTATAWLAQSGMDSVAWPRIPGRLIGAAVVTVIVSITGALAALGDTLFPAASLAAGMRQDFASASSALLRLRLLHPAIAILGAAYLVWAAFRFREQRAGARVIWLTVIQLGVGAMNVSLLAPAWMQLTHLLLADLVWIAVILLVLETTKGRRMQMQTAAEYASDERRALEVE